MTKFIQIRGGNATGKSTMVRSYINHYGFQKAEVMGVPVMKKGGVCILGEYSSGVCGGCDRFVADKIWEYIKILYSLNFKVLIFESFMLSKTYEFTKRLCNVYGKKNFYFIFCDVDFTVAYKKIKARNNNKKINDGVMFSSYISTRRSILKLEMARCYVKRVNPYEYTKDECYKLIDDVMKEIEEDVQGA